MKQAPTRYLPEVWGPHYWFFLHTVAHTYPDRPNDVTRRKYYELVQNMPLFIPDPEIGDRFSQLLDAYPVTPYLKGRESFVLWTCFIHNKVNEGLDRDPLSHLDAVDAYFAQYRSPAAVTAERMWASRKMLFWAVIVGLLVALFVVAWQPSADATAGMPRIRFTSGFS